MAGKQQSLDTWHHYLSTQSALGKRGFLICGFNQPLIKNTHSPKYRSLQRAHLNLLHSSSYLDGIYIVLDIVSHLETI